MIRSIEEVVILNDYATLTGGSTAVAMASALGLADRGIKVTYFSCVGPIAAELQDVPNLEVVCLGQAELAKSTSKVGALVSGLRNAEAVAKLKEVLSAKNPENTLVHAHTWMKAMSPWALDTVTALGFSLVATLHDFFITCPSGGFYDHSTEQLCKRRPLSLSCLSCNCDRRNYAHKVWRSARTVLQNTVLRVPQRVSAYIGVSEFSLSLMRDYLPSGTPAQVVRNPVDCVDEGAADVGSNRAFVYVGRFVPEKGVRIFAEAAAASGLPAVFIGDGELMTELKQICPHAEFTGWLKPEQIRARLRQARALVFPPLWYETLGLVAVEAASAGVPAIVSDGCAAIDYVQHGRTGLHFAQGSVASLTQRMQELAADDVLTTGLGRAAYEWYWRDPWTAERHVDDLLVQYWALVQAEPASLETALQT